MKLYVIRVEGTDKEGGAVAGYLSSDSVLTVDDFALAYVRDEMLKKRDKASMKLMTSFNIEKMSAICDDLIHITKQMPGKALITYSVCSQDFTNEQMATLARFNRTRLKTPLADERDGFQWNQ